MANNKWSIVIENGYQGFAPLAFNNSLTEHGSGGHASVMTNCDIVNGDYITQGPALSDLTNGNQEGVVSELINYILDRAVTADTTYGIGVSKLFEISSTTVASGGSPSWPRTISGCTDGESVILLKGVLYYFFNKSSGGDIGSYDLSSTFDDNWGSTVPTGNAALQKAPHPVDKKEDIMVFGNGRYVGTYIANSNTLAPTKLDFGADGECADVLYNAGQWYLAINSGVTGVNRTQGQIYLYDGGAIASTLNDETGVGMQRIGFLYRINGIVYVAYQDLSSTGFIIGYISGTQIKSLARFTGTLPTFAQKTLYKNTILFLVGGSAYSAGAIIDSLPFQLSQIADGGHATTGAIAAPFGTPMIASSDGGDNHRLAQFSGYDTNCDWKSIVFPVALGRLKGIIDDIIVLTPTLGENARCDLTIESDQASSTSSVFQITTTSKRKHMIQGGALGIGPIEDFRVALDWSNGNSINACPIRKIKIEGHFTEE